MWKFLIGAIGLMSVVNGQDNRPWSQQGPNQPGGFGGSSWPNQPNNNPQFGQNPQQQGWPASGSNNPQWTGQGGVPPNNPPPGTVTGADRAIGNGAPQSWNNNPNQPPQWNNPNQPSWNQQPGQFGQPQPGQFNQPNGGQQPPLWNGQVQPGPGQPGAPPPGQQSWNNNNDPRFANPGAPGQPLWAGQSSTPYYQGGGGRPYVGGATTTRQFSYSLVSLTLFFCLARLFA